jgi:anaerobic magnesium-protoporphyrin IX monomethyl ester cyclase
MSSEKQILLIHPPFYRLFTDDYSYNRYPISLGYLARTILRDTDWNVMVYNADFNKMNQNGKGIVTFAFRSGTGYRNYLNNLKDFSTPIWDEIRATIQEYRPTVVGITAMTPNFASASIVAQIVKNYDDQITVIVGGPHPTIAGRDVVKSPFIDIAVKGEGELTIVEILQALEGKKTLEDVNGIIYKVNGNQIETTARDFIVDLSTLVFPYESVSDVLKDYQYYPLQAFNNVFANRGCPYDCSFCGSRYVWSRHVRFRPIDHLIREIVDLRKKGINTLYFCDDTFGANKRWLSEFCTALIKTCPGLKWSCEIHARLIDDDTLSLMKKAGCYKIELGIESGNNDILQRIRKQITIKDGLLAARRIRDHGIELHVYFLIGFPFETEQTLNDTFNAIKSLKNKASMMISIFTPFPHTELYDYCLKNGLIDESYDISLHNFQSLDCFCLYIPETRFREIAKNIEDFVDKSNHMYKLRRLLSGNTIWRIKEFGLSNSFGMLKKILINRGSQR